ncbi:MAG: hypothetical protein HY815_23445 [Candidatus Riflebacteria bacterium]|nr:hypothetical protein [Candidatus Riflebacteria bacterium]
MRTETRNVVLCCLYFFLAMAGYYVLKPIRESFFLHSQGAQNFPSVHILVGLATLVALQLYDVLVRLYTGGVLVVASNVVFVVGTCGMWAAMVSVAPQGALHQALAWVFYVWVSILAVFVVALFWALTHNVFTPEQGQRLYGFIGAGGILGGAYGGFVTERLSLVIGTDHLLLLAALLLAPCIRLGWVLQREASTREAAQQLATREGGSSWALVAGDRYLLSIALLVFLTMVIAELGDHQTQRVLEKAFDRKDQLTSFYGSLYRNVNVVGLIVNVVVTCPVQVRWGPWPGLVLLQLVAAGKALALVWFPQASLLRYGLTLDLAIHYSIYQASKELLYTPTSPAVKYRAKAVIDTLVFRLGLSTGALWVLFSLRGATLPAISIYVCILAVAAIVTSVRLDRQYRTLVGASSSTPRPGTPGR